MKLSLLFLLVVLFNCAYAQDDKVMQYIGVSVGGGYTEAYYKTVSTDEFHPIVDFLNMVGEMEDIRHFEPVYNFAYQRFINNRFSIGAAYSYQHVSFNIEPRYYTGFYGDVDLKIHNFSGRFLFHFFQKPLIQMYTGLRMGFNYNSIKLKKGLYATGGRIGNREGLRPAMQILYGLHLKIVNILYLNIELGLGPPYLFNAGLSLAI